MGEDLSAITDSEVITIDEGDYGGDGITEAPVWHPAGYLTFVRHRLGLLYRWDPKTGTSHIIREKTGRMTGCVLDQEGRLICCEGDNQRVTRIDPGSLDDAPAEDWPKTPEVLADAWEGKPLNKPNDVIIRSDGTIYFTDPVAEDRSGTVGFPGVYLITPSGELRLATDGCERPNGLAFSPDESVLYVAVTKPRLIRAFDVAKDGSLSNNRILGHLDIELTDMSFTTTAGPDGMKVDTDGRIYCTSGGGVWVFAPDGALIGIIEVPGKPRNVGFGGDDFSTLYICAAEKLCRLETKVKGIPTYTP